MDKPHNTRSPGHVRESQRKVRVHPTSMSGRRKSGLSAQSVSAAVALTRKLDDITKILANHTGIPRATILWYFIGRGLNQWIGDGMIHDPANPILDVIDKAGTKVLSDPQFESAINRLKAELSIIQFDWEANGEITLEVEDDEEENEELT